MVSRFAIIPVPDGYTVEEAAHEIRVFGCLTDGKTVTDDGVGGTWAVVEVND